MLEARSANGHSIGATSDNADALSGHNPKGQGHLERIALLRAACLEWPNGATRA